MPPHDLLVASLLLSGYDSTGMVVDIQHVAAMPISEKVTVSISIEEINGLTYVSTVKGAVDFKLSVQVVTNN